MFVGVDITYAKWFVPTGKLEKDDDSGASLENSELKHWVFIEIRCSDAVPGSGVSCFDESMKVWCRGCGTL